MRFNLVLLGFIVLFASCETGSNTVTPEKPKTKKEILSSDRWRITVYTSVYTDSGETKTVNHFHDSGLCWKDNYLLFHPNGLLSLDEGPTRCNIDDPQIVELGTWELVNNDAQIRFEGDSTVTADVLTLTDSLFSIRYYEVVKGHLSVSNKSYMHLK